MLDTEIHVKKNSIFRFNSFYARYGDTCEKEWPQMSHFHSNRLPPPPPPSPPYMHLTLLSLAFSHSRMRYAATTEWGTPHPRMRYVSPTEWGTPHPRIRYDAPTEWGTPHPRMRYDAPTEWGTPHPPNEVRRTHRMRYAAPSNEVRRTLEWGMRMSHPSNEHSCTLLIHFLPVILPVIQIFVNFSDDKELRTPNVGYGQNEM